MPALSDLSTPTPTSAGHYALDVPVGWRQGRGAYGGLVISSLVRAIEHAVGDPARTVRSITAELPGPVMAGTAEIAVDILRTGNSLSTARASLSQGGEVKAHIVGVLAATRSGIGPLAWQELVRPEVPAWTTIEPVVMAEGPWPEFAHNFEYRVVEGMPMSGATQSLGWLRSRLPGGLRDVAHIVAVMDAWWPTALCRLPALRPMATIVYSLDVVSGIAGLNPESPMIYRATSPVLADGYCLETRELWGEDGRLIAINHQTFAIIA
jgi:acyl-CoA thioesterase